MPEIQYPKNSNSDTAFVVQEGGQKNRVLMTVEDNDGTVEYSDSPNSTNAYVTIDGKKHRAVLTAPQDTSTLEMSDNPNSTKGYVTVDGKKHRVVLTANIAGGGSQINNQDIMVTTNGEYTADEGYTGLGTVTVNVSTTVPETYRVFRNYNGKLVNSIITPFIPLPAGTTNIDNYILYKCYSGTPSSVLSGAIDLSSLVELSGQSSCEEMFYDCTGITSVNLNSLTTVSGLTACKNMFRGCTGITSINLNSLTTVSSNNGCNQMFQDCVGLTSVVLTKLLTLSGSSCCSNMFSGCTNLTSLSFPALTSASFGTRTNQFTSIISGVTGCTIHFPSNLDPQGGSTVISSLSGYPKFGGTNTVLAFDLPATE